MLVLVPVSSMKTRCEGSSCACSSFQAARATATSARSCSLAYTVFFKAHIGPVAEAPHRPQTDIHATLLQPDADLLKRQIGVGLDQLEQPIGMVFEQRPPVAPHRVRRDALFPSPALHPFDRRTLADPKYFRCRPRRLTALDIANQPDTQFLRIGSRQDRLLESVTIRRIARPRPDGNPSPIQFIPKRL